MKMCTCNVLSGSKLLVIAAVVAAHVGVCAETNIPVPATYIMVCCHGADKGTRSCRRRRTAGATATSRRVRPTLRGSRNPIHVHESTKNDPYAYYNVVKEEIAKRCAGCACHALPYGIAPPAALFCIMFPRKFQNFLIDKTDRRG